MFNRNRSRHPRKQDAWDQTSPIALPFNIIGALLIQVEDGRLSGHYAPPGLQPADVPVSPIVSPLLESVLGSEFVPGVDWKRLDSPSRLAALWSNLPQLKVWFLDKIAASREVVQGKPAALLWSWKPQSDGKLLLSPALPEGGKVVETRSGAWLLVPEGERWLLSPLPCSGRLYKLAQQRSEWTRPDAAKFCESWAAVLPASLVSLPPVPVLPLAASKARLRCRIDYLGGSPEAKPCTDGLECLAAVCFAYGDVEVPLRGADVVASEGFRRDRREEHRWLSAMEKAGLRIWPHPFSRKEAFLGTWPLSWLRCVKDKSTTLIAPEAPPTDLRGWLELGRQLEALGVEVIWGDLSFTVRQPAGFTTLITEDSDPSWVGLRLQASSGGSTVDLTAALVNLAQSPDFPRQPISGESSHAVWPLPVKDPVSGSLMWLDLPLVELRRLIRALETAEAKDGTVRLHRSAVGTLGEWPHPEPATLALGQLLDGLRNARAEVEVPTDLKATLRHYQVDGLAWLEFLARENYGGILADDMGLGKTIQVLSHVLARKQTMPAKDRLPVLIVAPASVLWNWENEAAKFTPTLTSWVAYGKSLTAKRGQPKVDLVLTTYGTLLRQQERFASINFDLVVFDESQILKNRTSDTLAAAKKLQTRRRLGLTGTPIENHLGELWAQFDLIHPGLLGSAAWFRNAFQNPIEKNGSAEAAESLRLRIAPFMLRRLKSMVAKDLPDCTVTPVHLEMGEAQRAVYDQVLRQQQALLTAGQESGQRTALTVLNALLHLRQACVDPVLLDKQVDSTKWRFLSKRLPDLLSEGHSVILISAFTKLLELYSERLTALGMAHSLLTGDVATTARQAVVDDFQSGKTKILLLSLKAGGVGLNLTAADTVFHCDPWWNPAAEQQASDRAYRIGQDKPVFVYKLLISDSIEEHVAAMQEHKQQVADTVLAKGGMSALNTKDLLALFQATTEETSLPETVAA